MSTTTTTKDVVEISGESGKYNTYLVMEDKKLTRLSVMFESDDVFGDNRIIIAQTWRDVIDLRTLLDELVAAFQKERNKP